MIHSTSTSHRAAPTTSFVYAFPVHWTNNQLLWKDHQLDHRTKMEEKIRYTPIVGTRSLAGKPLAGFCATPIRRIPVLCGTVIHVLR